MIYYENRYTMTTALKNRIQQLSKRPLTEGELDIAVFNFAGAVECLLKMRMEVLREGGYINKSINKRTGRRAQLTSPKYTPVRLC